ncbi:uncharacterized protein LOC130692185 [Daphnia carinata]|uniref:uncharacterized protein LOC130692185 n=1 Tax=Daphnia carinata TaxID=120202 RepID=UPI00257D7BEC|nr:uncharacterized protein LOC130692185 [Daphnia carinata]
MSKRKTRLPSRCVIFLMCLCSIPSCSSATSGSNIGETFAEIAWNVIGVIRRIRHGSNTADVRQEENESQLVLNDPRFLYETFYRDDDKDEKASHGETERSNRHGNNPLLRLWDILEIEYNLRRLRRDARLSVTDGQKAIDESAVAATPATGDAPSVPSEEAKKMGGADGGGCNMADHKDGSSTGISGDSACSASIQRSPRQVAEELEPYVPYLGFIFYSFPIFSFTLPFGGQLKLFGYDFI